MMTQPDPSAEPQPQPGVPVDKPMTSLRLTKEREDWLVRLAIDLERNIEKVIGREKGGNTTYGSFLWVRRRNTDSHNDKWEWRATEFGGVFNVEGFFRGGISRGKSKEIQRVMESKLTDDLLGTVPFFAAIPARAGDPELVKNVEAFVQEKIEQAGIPQLLRDAISAALVRNEVTPFFSYEKVVSRFRGPATVAVDPQTGEPIRTPQKGFYIYENDDTVPNPDAQGEVILKKDPSFSTRVQLDYATFPDLEQEQVVWDGLRGTLMDNRDFICPTDVESIHDAKLCARRYDREWGQMREQYRGFDTSESYFNEHPESAAKTQSEQQGPRPQLDTDLIKWVHVAEVYIRCDADEDGVEEEIMLILDMDNEKPIFYDYLFNHMKKRPFEVVVGLRKEANSWAGVGVYSETLHPNTFIDLTLNRVNKKDSQQGSVTCVNPKALKGWVNEQPVEVGGPGYEILNEGYGTPDRPAIVRYQLVESLEDSMKMSGTAAQDLAVMFGSATAASASANELDRSGTATGNAIQEKESNLITKAAMHNVSVGILACLAQCVDIVLEHMDETELFLTKELKLVTLSREEVRTIEKQVKLLLTKSRSAEGLAMSQQAMTIVLQYLDLDPLKRRSIRDFVVSMLKSLEVPDAEQKVPEVTNDEITAWMKQQQQVNQPPANASVSVKLTDLTPDERSQVLQNDYKIVPSNPQEVAAWNAQQAATEAASKPQNVVPMKPAAEEGK